MSISNRANYQTSLGSLLRPYFDCALAARLNLRSAMIFLFFYCKQNSMECKQIFRKHTSFKFSGKLLAHTLARIIIENLAKNIKSALSVLRQFLATENPLKMMKNAFYFNLTALFVLKISRFLPWIFGRVEKRLG